MPDLNQRIKTALTEQLKITLTEGSSEDCLEILKIAQYNLSKKPKTALESEAIQIIDRAISILDYTNE